MLLTGEHSVSLDEKGRLLIPSRLKSQFDTTTLVVTKSSDSRRCLQVLKPENFEKLANTLLDDGEKSFDPAWQLLQMHVVAPATEVQFDKAGRIMISANLRAFASLELKSEIMVVGMMNRIEIWNKALYESYIAKADDPAEIENAVKQEMPGAVKK